MLISAGPLYYTLPTDGCPCRGVLKPAVILADIVCELQQVIEQEDQPDGFPPSPSTGSFGNSSAGAFTGMRSSQALLEAAVSSAIRHPCIVETYDYQLVAPSLTTCSDPLILLTGTMVHMVPTLPFLWTSHP